MGGQSTSRTMVSQRALIIDDDVLMASLLQRLLSTEYTVTVCHNGRQALERLMAGERFDVIISDLQMPEMSGHQLFDAIAERLPGLLSCIVAITASAERVAYDIPVVRKPIDPETLRTILRTRKPSPSIQHEPLEPVEPIDRT